MLHLQTGRFGWALLTNGKSPPLRFLRAYLLCHKSHDVGVFDNPQIQRFKDKANSTHNTVLAGVLFEVLTFLLKRIFFVPACS